METNDPDPRRLIAEAYTLPGLTEEECRSIFLDWVLGLPEGTDVPRAAREVLSRSGAPDGHPLTPILVAATETAGPPRRRGGRRRLDG